LGGGGIDRDREVEIARPVNVDDVSQPSLGLRIDGQDREVSRQNDDAGAPGAGGVVRRREEDDAPT